MAALRLGIVGVGIGALQTVPHLKQVAAQVELTAIADVRRDNLEYFAAQYGKPLAMYDDAAQLFASPQVDGVWIASPNRFHAEHVIAAANAGKHVICEKPMAITLEQCAAMVEAVQRNQVKYVQGHSKVYDAPIQALGEVVASGELGRVIHIQTWNWNDWLIRSIVADEVDTSQGTGVVFRQGPHQLDTLRYLAGAKARSVKAIAGRWDPHYPKGESNYTAFLDFDNGVAATAVFDGHGYFDVTELTWGIGESGKRHRNYDSVLPRERPPGPVSEADKYAKVRAGNPYGYGRGAGPITEAPQQQPFFGITVVTCERGVIRQSPEGLYLYGAEGRREIKCPPSRGRAAELLELHDAVTQNRPTLLDARWGMATTEICLAILQSSRERREIGLSHQSEPPLQRALAR